MTSKKNVDDFLFAHPSFVSFVLILLGLVVSITLNLFSFESKNIFSIIIALIFFLGFGFGIYGSIYELKKKSYNFSFISLGGVSSALILYFVIGLAPAIFQFSIFAKILMIIASLFSLFGFVASIMGLVHSVKRKRAIDIFTSIGIFLVSLIFSFAIVTITIYVWILSAGM